jgi:hypothetical protein
MYTPTVVGMSPTGVGVDGMQSLTLFENEPSEPSFPNEARGDEEAQAVANNGNPTIPILGLIGGLVALGFLRESSSHLKSNTMALNAFNFTVYIFTAIIGIVLAKVIFTRWKVPGVTQLVHAV